MAGTQALQADPSFRKADLPRKLDAGLLAISGLLPSMARPTSMYTTANRPPLIISPWKVVGNMVLIEAIPMRGATTLSADLASLGFQQARQNNGVVAGWLPTNSVVQLERVPSLRLARSILATTRLGRVTAQNDIALRAPAARGTFGVSGRGKRVGILSDSFNSLGGMAGGIASNDLPASIDIISDPLASSNQGAGLVADEGRAMGELIHDIAPGAPLAFYSAFLGQHDFANGIRTMGGLVPASASRKCDVIVDDVFYFAEPVYADGVIAQAIDAVRAAGVPCFTSAGNDGRNAFEDSWRTSTAQGGPYELNEYLHQFNSDLSNPQTSLPITLPPGESLIVLDWADAYISTSPADPANPGSQHDIDLWLTWPDGTFAMNDGVAVGSFLGNIGGDPQEFMWINNPGGPVNAALQIGYFLHRDGNPTPPAGTAPRQFKLRFYAMDGGNITVNAFPEKASKGTIFGHANAAGAFTVGAAPYWRTPAYGVSIPELEPYSSAGGTLIYNLPTGAPIAAPVGRGKPDFCAPDAGNVTVPGNPANPWPDIEGDGWPNFSGTSASVAGVAAIAALMLEANPSLTPDALGNALRSSAIDMMSAGPDPDSGVGLINAMSALNLVKQPIAILGDLDADGCVCIKDRDILTAAIMAKSGDRKYDLNQDGKVNVADARFILSLYTRPGGACQ